MRVISDFREAMWGVVQSVSSSFEFEVDYAAGHSPGWAQAPPIPAMRPDSMTQRFEYE